MNSDFQLTEEQIVIIRKNCLRSLYCFCKTVMGYDDIVDTVHGDYCRHLEGPSKRKQSTMPRSFVKTWIGTIAYAIWIALPRTSPDEFPEGVDPGDKFYQLGPNIRILIASYVISNAEKMISLIRKTYESNTSMQILFPEVIPENFKKVRWSNDSACINRNEQFTESTFEAAGIGGASTSRHYDLIIEDDLIYATKDDLSGRELQPNQEDIDKAIGWHKMATSLLVPGAHTHIHNQGTRWARHDLVSFIWENEPSYKVFRRACVELPDEVLAGGTDIKQVDWRECNPSWPEAYGREQLEVIAAAQGFYMFATQYLLLPTSPQELFFKPQWLQLYNNLNEIPKNVRTFTTIDLSEWEPTNNKQACVGVVMTCSWDEANRCFVKAYDSGRFSPSEIINLMVKHWNEFSPEAIYPEGIYYQKAVAHFARVWMDEGKIPRMTIRNLLPQNKKSKGVRIMEIEPVASSGGLFVRQGMKELINEFNEYIPTNRLCKVDHLDALAYQVQVYRPAMVTKPVRNRISELPEGVVTVDCDELLQNLWAENKKNIYSQELPPIDPFEQQPEFPFIGMGVPLGAYRGNPDGTVDV